MDEGYIKFQSQWTKSEALSLERLENLIFWRDILYQKELIGVYKNGIGYGNISERWNAEGQFIISGSMTGHLQTLSNEHFTLVTKVNISKNMIWCEGPIIASSESMSHAVIYQECPEIQGVMHVHHAGLWEKLLHKVPTTNASATYGSPEMAYSIIELLQKTDLRKQKIFVMEGHPEGIFVFGESLKEAAAILLQQIAYL
ncbi:MAG: class II aldolase/adducin family protein [Saprospiraceae bacterium]|nr:class II aldolase/adducin family protein [Saprospiraceae bacterium]